MRLYDTAQFDLSDPVALKHDGTIIGQIEKIRWRNTPRPMYRVEQIWYKEEHLTLVIT